MLVAAIQNIVRNTKQVMPRKNIYKCKKKCEWLTAGILESMHDRDNKDPDDWSTAKLARNLVNEICKKAKEEFVKQKLTEEKGDPKKFWRHFKPLLNDTGAKENTDLELDYKRLSVPDALNAHLMGHIRGMFHARIINDYSGSTGSA